MRKTIFFAGIVAAAALAACGDADVEYNDTATVPGFDTSAGLAVPTTDTLLTTTPLDTSMRRDSLMDTTATP